MYNMDILGVQTSLKKTASEDELGKKLKNGIVMLSDRDDNTSICVYRETLISRTQI